MILGSGMIGRHFGIAVLGIMEGRLCVKNVESRIGRCSLKVLLLFAQRRRCFELNSWRPILVERRLDREIKIS